MKDNQQILKKIIGKLNYNFGLDTDYKKLEEKLVVEMNNAVGDSHPELTRAFDCDEIGSARLAFLNYLNIKNNL